MALRVTTLRGLRQEAVAGGDNAAPTAILDPATKAEVETAAGGAASKAAWTAVKKGIVISAVLTGIQIIYDLRCAKLCQKAKS